MKRKSPPPSESDPNAIKRAKRLARLAKWKAERESKKGVSSVKGTSSSASSSSSSSSQQASSTGVVTNSTASLTSSKTTTTISAEEKKRRRQERLAKWKAERLLKSKKQEENAKRDASSTQALASSKEKPVATQNRRRRKSRFRNAFSMETSKATKKTSQNNFFKKTLLLQQSKNDNSIPMSTTTPPAKTIDPLDAFMASLAQSETTVDAVKTISLEDIMSEGVTNKEDTSMMTNGEHRNVVPTQEQTATENLKSQKDQSDDGEEEFHKAFLSALIKPQVKNGNTGNTGNSTASMSPSESQGEENRSMTSSSQSERRTLQQQSDFNDIDEHVLLESEILRNADRASSQSVLLKLRARMAKKELARVDHSKIDYVPFRKSFYKPSREVENLSDAFVTAKRKEWEIKVRGKNPPKPVLKWDDLGLHSKILELLEHDGMGSPFPIQAQAIPCIMDGRDVIGVAKTGSGKTLAFVLPLLRHILSQPAPKPTDGPIGLIIAPARELAVQIFKVAKRFCHLLNIPCACIYGGAPVRDQINQLKRGASLIVCTPGRLIDMLCINNGRLIKLRRTSFVIVDEADRMFDLGFEPQIARIFQNIQPGRQTVLFSATFPAAVETLARKILKKDHRPIEIVVGGRSVASGLIEQFVEHFDDEALKFRRLLQILGKWWNKGQILIFVDSQRFCDQLFTQLNRAGYLDCLTLHGGKDQVDRSYTISDFKRGVKNLLIATSVAGRGLDVKNLKLVINYVCPNHLEDYVHRVGRTGRAGSTAEEKFAPYLCKALKESKQTIPEFLTKMNQTFREKVKNGEARWASSGFSGKGFSFSANEKNAEQKHREMQRKTFEVESGIIDDSEINESGQQDDAEMNTDDSKHNGNSNSVSAKYPPVIRKSEYLEKQAAQKLTNGSGATLKTKKTKNGNDANGNSSSSSSSSGVTESGKLENQKRDFINKDVAVRNARRTKAETEKVLKKLRGEDNVTTDANMTTDNDDGASLPQGVREKKIADIKKQESILKECQAVLDKAIEKATLRWKGMQAAKQLMNISEQLKQDEIEQKNKEKRAAAAAAKKAAERNDKNNNTLEEEESDGDMWIVDVLVNDYAPRARQFASRRESTRELEIKYDVTFTPSGTYIPMGRQAGAGESKLTVTIEGKKRILVERARNSLIRKCEEMTETAASSTQGLRSLQDQYRKYSVL
eukprot:g2383.t1